MLLGVSPQYKDVRNLVVLAGRFFDDQDAARSREGRRHRQAASREHSLATRSAAIDRSITIRGIPFVIIGVFKESIDTFGQSEISEQTMLDPLRGCALLHRHQHREGDLLHHVADSRHGRPRRAEILAFIKSRHRPTVYYRAQPHRHPQHDMAQIADMLTIVLTLAAAITLIVCGVGIMNSMLANVQSRIREIGIRKALGATSHEIRLQFLTEAVFLSLSGGIVGTILGLAIPLRVGLLTPFKIPVVWSAVAHCHLRARRCALRNTTRQSRCATRPRPDAEVRVTHKEPFAPAVVHE